MNEPDTGLRRERSRELAALAAATAAVGLLLLVTEPVPQDPAYHDFADARALWGVTNFWNVVSNLPFLVVGLLGLARSGLTSGRSPNLAPEYRVFFTGVTLTAFGSAYYHLAPSNATLVFDRLPMTVAFAGLVGLAVGLYVARRHAHPITVAWLVLGVLSVAYWAATEARGGGDLRLYAVVQFVPMAVLPCLLLDRRRRLPLNRYFWFLAAAYAMAKLAEHFDHETYALLPLSGHSLKHLLAALGAGGLIAALARTPARGVEPSD